MRDGGVPFRTVFSSQGPLFLPLAYLGDLLAGQSINGPRVLGVASGVGVVLAIYWCAAQITDRLGAVVAGVLTATSGSLMWVTAPLAADGPALAFAALAVGIAIRHRDNPRVSTALGLGLAVGACLSTKAMEAPVLLPVVLVLALPLFTPVGALGGDRIALRALRAQTLLCGAVSAAAAAAVFLVLAFSFGFSETWDQSFTYRADAASQRDVLGNARKVFSTLWDRDLVLLSFTILVLVAAVLARVAGRRAATVAEEGSIWSLGAGAWKPTSRLLAWSWVVLTFLWLVFMVSPLWRPHVSAMVPPLALLLGIYRPPLRTTAVAAVIALPLLWIQLDGLRNPGDYRGSEAEVMEVLASLPDGAWALSDEPGLLWRSGIRTTDDLVDPSMLRVQQGRYDEDSLVAAAADPNVCAVVVRSDQRFGAFPELGSRLGEIGFVPVLDQNPPAVVHVRTDCSPTG